VSEADTNLRAGQCAQTLQTHRHTPMTTRPCGLRRAGNYAIDHWTRWVAE